MKLGTILSSIIIFFLLGFCSHISAHGLVTTESEVVGDYEVRMEYDSLTNISAGGTTSFNFELVKSKNKEEVDFDRVFFRVLKKEGDYPIVFDGNLYRTIVSGEKYTKTTIYIPKEGLHKFEVSYFKGSRELVAHTFELNVESGYSSQDENNMSKSKFKYLGVIVFLGGLILGVVLNRVGAKNK